MTLAGFGKKLATLGEHRRHRHAVHVSGDADSSLRAALELGSEIRHGHRILYGESHPTAASLGFITLNNKKAARQYLGGELGCVVIDGHKLFDPDAIGILSGCIRSGGMMIFVTPPLSEWPGTETLLLDTKGTPSAYLSRIAGILGSCQQLVRVSAEGLIESCLPEIVSSSMLEIDYSEQKAAIRALKAINIHPPTGTVVLESDRGRGKSAALGIVARELVQEKGYRIGVTGHGRRSTETLLAHASRDSGEVVEKIRYYSPDLLIETKQDIDLLLVDEAATLPLSILKKLLGMYPHIAFATTIHGYEGTGKGFSVKFHEILNQQKPAWRLIKLEQPIRWGRNDPLEALINRLLLLDAEPASGFGQEPVTSTSFLEYDPVRLIGDEERLCSLYAILARAHYRTAPSDLMRILDGGDLRMFGLEDQNRNILSVALIAVEGELPQELVEQVTVNQRRPKNHLLPVALCTQLGFCKALTMRVARIIRIAVNPNVAGRSHGKQLMSRIIRHLEAGFDLIGASFGLDSPLHEFWIDSGFSLVRIGVRKNRSTGTHSGLVIRGLSGQGKKLATDAANRFSVVAQFEKYCKNRICNAILI
ncbi:MAG: tRNA(Met) cytidine acetyltransferase [Gammaproteobacteria bacterium]|nr:tRNA(Met) cytidine acetyltransferase [Gammaproteobacteria bacterium]